MIFVRIIVRAGDGGVCRLVFFSLFIPRNTITTTFAAEKIDLYLYAITAIPHGIKDSSIAAIKAFRAPLIT